MRKVDAQQIRMGRAQPRPYPGLDKPGGGFGAWVKIRAERLVRIALRGRRLTQGKRDRDHGDRVAQSVHVRSLFLPSLRVAANF